MFSSIVSSDDTDKQPIKWLCNTSIQPSGYVTLGICRIPRVCAHGSRYCNEWEQWHRHVTVRLNCSRLSQSKAVQLLFCYASLHACASDVVNSDRNDYHTLRTMTMCLYTTLLIVFYF